MDEAVGADNRLAHIVHRPHSTAKRRGQLAHEGAGPLGNHVEDGQFVRAHVERGESGRRACPTCTKLNDAPERRAGKGLDKAAAEPSRVGVVADPSTAVENHRVDGADGACAAGELAEKRHHFLFAGVGNIQAGKAEALGGCQQLREGRVRQTQRFEIDEPVDAADSMCGCFAFMHLGRARGLNINTDETK